MHLRELKLTDFRCFTSLSLNLDRDLTVLFGVNGSGKSTIVDAIALALTVIPGHDQDLRLTTRDLRLTRPGSGGAYQKEQAPHTEISVRLRGEKAAWGWRLNRGGAPEPHLGTPRLPSRIQRTIDKKEGLLPLIAIYRANRIWGDGNLQEGPPEGRLAGYLHCLDAGRDLSGLRGWWRQQDHLRRADQPMEALGLAEEAIRGLGGPEAAPPVYDPQEKDILIDLPDIGGRLALRELSDGYRGLVALIVDLVRRSAQLNPLSGPTLLADQEGVVVIDEIDLHLHPQLQRQVLGYLRDIFPKVQFVVTTHSPLVLWSVDHNEDVIRLGAAHSPETGLKVIGRDPSQIIQHEMGTSIDRQELNALVRRLHEAIDGHQVDEAERLLAELAEKWSEDDPRVVYARGLLDWER